jgi:hypothetical protein
MERIGTVETICRYPVKSMAGEEVTQAFVGFVRDQTVVQEARQFGAFLNRYRKSQTKCARRPLALGSGISKPLTAGEFVLLRIVPTDIAFASIIEGVRE